MTTNNTILLQASLKEIIIQKKTDQYPDFWYLDQFANSTDPEEQKQYIEDQERKAEYGNTWEFIFIRAIAVILIPTPAGGFIAQEIKSGGLYNIESDSGKDYFTSVATEECAQLRDYLQILNVDTSNFEELEKKAFETL